MFLDEEVQNAGVNKTFPIMKYVASSTFSVSEDTILCSYDKLR